VLSNKQDDVNEHTWESRDSIWLTPSDAGIHRFAEFLLNAGNPENPISEYAFEGDAGHRNVAPMSAELRLFLPGSDGWIFAAESL
jgi:hypothetical protein